MWKAHHFMDATNAVLLPSSSILFFFFWSSHVPIFSILHPVSLKISRVTILNFCGICVACLKAGSCRSSKTHTLESSRRMLALNIDVLLVDSGESWSKAMANAASRPPNPTSSQMPTCIMCKLSGKHRNVSARPCCSGSQHCDEGMNTRCASADHRRFVEKTGGENGETQAPA